jgi:hypothetical protein
MTTPQNERSGKRVLELIASGESYSSIGRIYGVTGNAVKKWVIRDGLTPPKMKVNIVDKYKDRLGTEITKVKLKKILNRKTIKKDIAKYRDKLIDHESSPTGKAYIGINKKPLMKNENGIGYQGVLLQDEYREFVQCSGCGKWFQKITNFHTKKCIGGTTDDYKKRFGLFKSTGLISDASSLRCTRAALKNKESITNKRFKANQTAKNFKMPHQYKKAPRENENRFGNCPEQLKYRLYTFIYNNRELPNCHNRGRALARAIYNRYGRLGEAFKHFGLPRFFRLGTTLEFTFPDGYKAHYNINKFGDREQFFEQMISRCPEFNKYINP